MFPSNILKRRNFDVSVWIYILYRDSFQFESKLLICHMKNKNQNETVLFDPCDF